MPLNKSVLASKTDNLQLDTGDCKHEYWYGLSYLLIYGPNYQWRRNQILGLFHCFRNDCNAGQLPRAHCKKNTQEMDTASVYMMHGDDSEK